MSGIFDQIVNYGSGSSSSATGTVTSVSVVSANGVTASVANPTTTPALTFALGAITPSTVNGNTITAGSGTLNLAGYSITAAQSGVLGSAAFTSVSNYVLFRYDITGPSGGGTNLDAVPTAGLNRPTLIITFYGNALRPWILTASSGTPVTTTGITVPLDWNASTNNVQWTEIAFS
jgi:hypothetical protein